MKPTNKDIIKTLSYYLAVFLGALGLFLLILSANWVVELVSSWFK